jgi:hypothetical protein
VKPAKPEHLFTAGIDAKDGSMVVHPSNEKLLSVCVPNGKGN